MNLCSSDPKTKTIAVMGATGIQGGSLVQAFHSLKESGNNEFQVRAITRDPTSEKAKIVEPLVQELVKADGNDVESMVKALKDCYGVYIVSDWWQDMDVAHEMQLLRNLKDASKKTGVKHIVLSTLEDSRPFVNSAENKDTWKVLDEEKGMYVLHFDGKDEVAKEFMEEGLPTTCFYTTFYYENFINLGLGPSRQSESEPYSVTFPIGDAKMNMVAVADIGKAACAIFQDETLIGKSVGVKSQTLTGKEIADLFTQVCGQPVNYNAVPWDVYASFGFPGAAELANMFRFFEEDEENFHTMHKLCDDLLEKEGGAITLEEWVTTNKGAFDLKEMESTIAPEKEVHP